MRSLLTTVGLTILAASTPSTQTGDVIGAFLDVATPLHVARLVAGNGLSGGIVLRLPEQLEERWDKTRTRSDIFPNQRTPFAVLTSSVPLGGNMPTLPLNTPVEDILARYAQRAADQWEVTGPLEGRATAALRVRGTVCAGPLARRTSRPHAGSDPVTLAARIAADATGAAVPPGFVSTCVGDYQSRPDVVSILPGEPLEAALDQLAARFAGTVWIVVETGRGECSLGLLFKRSETRDVCQAPITAHLGSRR